MTEAKRTSRGSIPRNYSPVSNSNRTVSPMSSPISIEKSIDNDSNSDKLDVPLRGTPTVEYLIRSTAVIGAASSLDSSSSAVVNSISNQTQAIKPRQSGSNLTSKHKRQFFKNSRKTASFQPYKPNEETIELDQCHKSISNQHLPAFVDFCVSMIEKHGLMFVGIYRVPGNNISVAAIKKRFESIADSYDVMLNAPVDPHANSKCDVAAYTSALKSFLRSLSDPVFPNELYTYLTEANRLTDRKQRLLSLKRLIQSMPKCNYETLRHLMAHLKLISQHSDTNKMDSRNLSIVFGPTLMRSYVLKNETSSLNNAPDQSLSTSLLVASKKAFRLSNGSQSTPALGHSMAADALDQCLIVQTVMNHHHWFFDDNTEDSNVPVEDNSELDSPSSCMKLAFSSLHSSFSINPDRSDDEALSTSPPSGRNFLQVPKATAIQKSAPDIPAKVAELSSRKSGDEDCFIDNDQLLSPTDNTVPSPQVKAKANLRTKLQVVRKLFKKSSADNLDAFDDAASRHTHSLSTASSCRSPVSLNSFESFEPTPPNSAGPNNDAGRDSYFSSSMNRMSLAAQDVPPKVPPRRDLIKRQAFDT